MSKKRQINKLPINCLDDWGSLKKKMPYIILLILTSIPKIHPLTSTPQHRHSVCRLQRRSRSIHAWFTPTAALTFHVVNKNLRLKKTVLKRRKAGTMEVQRLCYTIFIFFEWFFRKDYCFSKGLFHQQFQGEYSALMVDLNSRVEDLEAWGGGV